MPRRTLPCNLFRICPYPNILLPAAGYVSPQLVNVSPRSILGSRFYVWGLWSLWRRPGSGQGTSQRNGKCLQTAVSP